MNAFVDAAVILLLLGIALGAPDSALSPDSWAWGVPAACWLAAVTPALVRSDLTRRRLPNALTLPAVGLAIAGAGAAVLTGASGRDPAVAVGVLGATGLLGVIGAARGGIGMGDVKLGAALAGSTALIDIGALPVFAVVTGLGGLVAASATWWRGRQPSGGRRPSGGRQPPGGRRRRAVARRLLRAAWRWRGAAGWGRRSSSVQVALAEPEAHSEAAADACRSGDEGDAPSHSRVPPRCATPSTRYASEFWLRELPLDEPWMREGPEAGVDGWADGEFSDDDRIRDDPWGEVFVHSDARGPVPMLVAPWALAPPPFWNETLSPGAGVPGLIGPPFSGSVPLTPDYPGSSEPTGVRHLPRRDPDVLLPTGTRATIPYGPCLLVGYWCGMAACRIPVLFEAGILS